MNGKTIFAAWFNPDALVPGDGVADTGLRLRRRHHDRVAEGAGGVEERFETGSVNAVVICEQKFHGMRKANVQRSTG